MTKWFGGNKRSRRYTPIDGNIFTFQERESFQRSHQNRSIMNSIGSTVITSMANFSISRRRKVRLLVELHTSCLLAKRYDEESKEILRPSNLL